MATPAVSRDSPRAYRERQSLLLRIWEVASSQPSVAGLLAAVVDILVEVVPFSAATLICFGPEGPRVCGTHITKRPRVVPGDRATVGRLAEIALPGGRDRMPPAFSNLQRMMISGKPFSCTDLLAKQAWHEHESHHLRGWALGPMRGSL